MNFIKRSYQDELDGFFQAFKGYEVSKRIVSKVALSKARMKLKYEAFVELNRHLIDFFYRNFQPITWQGLNLLAIDGSTARLPRIEEIAKHFGVWHSKGGAECPIAKVSQMFDVLNNISIDAVISPKSVGERELAAQHFLNLLPADLILLDRGYPAYWLFNLILSLGSNFCARISCTKWKIIRKFYHSGKKEQIIYLTQVTERENIKRKYDASIGVIAMLNLDNLDDAVSVLDVSNRSFVQGRFLEALEAWGEEYSFYITPLTNSKLIAVMNKKSLMNLVSDEFKIVDKIAEISRENDLMVTLSAGIACSNIKLNELGDIAQDALDLALSRGGDQVVVNVEGNDLMYFGGNTNTAEKRTRITTRTNTKKLEKLFEESKNVYIAPHTHPDTDALGASLGILKLAQAYGKNTFIVLDKNNLDKTVDKILNMIEYEYITLLGSSHTLAKLPTATVGYSVSRSKSTSTISLVIVPR